MKCTKVQSSRVAAIVAAMALGTSSWAATTVQIGASGKTYASSVVQCAADPNSGALSPVVEAGLFNPTTKTRGTVSLNGNPVADVTSVDPSTDVWLVDGINTVVVVLNKRTADSYQFGVAPGTCALPDTSGNTFSADGTLEYAASGKSSATVTPGCALNGATGLAQPYVHLFDNGDYLLNVSVNGVRLTQLSRLQRHTPVFLSAGVNVISAVNAYLSIRLQTSMNLALGSALASIGLTIPVVAVASVAFHLPLTLGLEPKDLVLLALTFLVGAITLGTGRTNVMQGAVHLVIFAAFLFLALVP